MKNIEIDLAANKPKTPARYIKNFDPSYITRYSITAAIIASLQGGSKKKLSILDVGGNDGAIAHFFPTHEVMLTDILDAPRQKNYVKYDGNRLPFDDQSFDIVISCDTLEHVLPKMREKFASELTRVSRQHIILCAPFGAPQVKAAEATANAFYKGSTGQDYQWLKEHAEYGLPKASVMQNAFERARFQHTSIEHTSLDLWIAMTCANFFAVNNIHPVAQDLANKLRKVNSKYLNELAYNDFPARGYRTFWIASRKERPVVKLPKYEAQNVADFIVEDMSLAGEILAALTHRIGEAASNGVRLGVDNQLLRKELRAARKQLRAIETSKKYQLLMKVAKLQMLLKRGR